MNQLTVVMYHYVRDLARSAFPRINGLDTSLFEEQVHYIKRHYNVIDGQELLAAIDTGTPLPPRCALLTFDDGYIDHYSEVYPILKQEKIGAVFFPPARSVLEKEVLDVNKIHFVLASVDNPLALVDAIKAHLEDCSDPDSLLSFKEYWAKLAIQGRYDPPEIVFIKRMLQRALPEQLREKLTDNLFKRFVTEDESAFASELYMSIDQLRELQSEGITIGSHGYNHLWLDAVSPDVQAEEIDSSIKFLQQVGVDTDNWLMCYPYGAYDDSLLSILRTRHCRAAFTTEVGLSSLNDNPLTLSRINTNDLPKDALAPANSWTIRASGTECG